MSKYDPLREYLEHRAVEISEIILPFSKIEGILGFTLPKSAYTYREWWSNPTSPKQHPYAQCWLVAGWKVDTVNFNDKWVRFKRHAGR